MFKEISVIKWVWVFLRKNHWIVLLPLLDRLKWFSFWNVLSWLSNAMFCGWALDEHGMTWTGNVSFYSNFPKWLATVLTMGVVAFFVFKLNGLTITDLLPQQYKYSGRLKWQAARQLSVKKAPQRANVVSFCILPQHLLNIQYTFSCHGIKKIILDNNT